MTDHETARLIRERLSERSGARRRTRRALAGAIAAAAILPAAILPAAMVSAAMLPEAAGAEVAAAKAPVGRPFVRDGQTVPTYSYANAIRESVWVRTPLDNDRDGQPDRVAVDVIRPREAAQNGVKVPVIMVPSPYYAEAGRGNESEVKTYDAAGEIAGMPLYYDNYFVPRGYAVAQVDMIGTNRSTGCADVGGQAEVLGIKAAVDWLNGRATATRKNGTAAVANWTTGKVGLIGKSWDATLANGVAATGVPGLATIVPIAGISSWYHYLRLNGVPRSLEDAVGLHSFVSGRPAGVCDPVINGLRTGADDATGNYNTFWAARDYRPAAERVRASVFVVHGQGDLNVKTSQFAAWWSALAGYDVPRKLWLSQTGHVDPFDYRRAAWVDTLHRWFDHWLQDLENGVMAEPTVSIERAPGQWVDQEGWPPAGTAPASLALGPGDGTTGTLGGPAGSGVRGFTDKPSLSESAAVTNPNTAKAGRLVFLSAPLAAATRYAGSPALTLRIKVSKPTTELTARLVDYGTATRVDLSNGQGIHDLTTESCWGESTAADDACYLDTAEDVASRDLSIVGHGWLDAAHYQSLSQRTPLDPNTWYTVRVPLEAADTIVPARHVLGLVITGSDRRMSTPSSTGAGIQVDLGASSLALPIAGAGTVASAGTPPRVSGADAPPPTPGRNRLTEFR
jgi:X-Pro dipeptidyl-peptidase